MTNAIFHPSKLPADTKCGILHLGLGAFHRAHQAFHTQQAMVEAGGDWGIEAVSMRSSELADGLNAQGGRYCIVERHGERDEVHEITAIQKAYALTKDVDAITDRLADPSIQIVTLTITEKGYCFDGPSRRLNTSDPAIAHDLNNPNSPQTAIGVLAEGLRKRQAAGHSGMSILSCDNLTNNGDLLKKLALDFVERTAAHQYEWINSKCTFPNSMVDRITPATTDKTLEAVESATHRKDRLAVETEPFSQWVIEDNFAGPRPVWEKAGVLIVDDVAPFEKMKLRLLNGSHTLIACLGAFHDLLYVRDVMANPVWRDTVRDHMQSAAKTLDLPTSDYIEALISRFSNPAIAHACLQIAMDTSQKLPQRIFAPASEKLAKGLDVSTDALTIAAWIYALNGTAKSGSTIELSDPLIDKLQSAIRPHFPNAKASVEALSKVDGLHHEGVLNNEVFRDEIEKQMVRLIQNG